MRFSTSLEQNSSTSYCRTSSNEACVGPEKRRACCHDRLPGRGLSADDETARRLYREHAESLPIFDYHTHLSAADIASDRRFNNLYEIWLEGDHYKWRAMRAFGTSMPERYCTGKDTHPYDKFTAWSRTVPHTLRNPLYHWTHLELRRAFGIMEPLNVKTAPEIWERANTALQEGLTARAILRKFNVQAVFTTDDPVDDLAAHRRILEEGSDTWIDGERRRRYEGVDVRPTFRPDRALKIDQSVEFFAWLRELEEASNTEVRNLATFLDALSKRHAYFSELYCCASDHGMERCPARPCSEPIAAKVFAKVLDKQPASPEECEQYATFVMLHLARLNSQKQWTMQLHLGARRNVNRRAYDTLGPDTGFDSIGDSPQGAALATFLDLLQRENAMPQMVLYNSNPADNYVFASLAGSFHNGRWMELRDGRPSAVQHGPAWWFLDQKEGIVNQLNALSSVGLLSRFIGMTTDSRSFLSFPRHEYFRRILCDLVGGEVERGELPDDEDMLAGLVLGVCFANASAFFRIEGPPKGLMT